jgi:hypothetical protein
MTKASVTTRTRSGRVSKVPERLDPVEDLPEDDFDDDYETESDIDSEEDIDLMQTDDEDDFTDGDEDDMDENGNLKGFVVDDEEDDGEE